VREIVAVITTIALAITSIDVPEHMIYNNHTNKTSYPSTRPAGGLQLIVLHIFFFKRSANFLLSSAGRFDEKDTDSGHSTLKI